MAFAQVRTGNRPLSIDKQIYNRRELCTDSDSSNSSLQQKFDTKGEQEVFALLLSELQPIALEVKDVSGGCGSMYSIRVRSEKFNSLTTVKQHMLVNQILKERIPQWHGLQLVTEKVKK
ncbi:Bol3p KNAG_0E04120 [Huiozyma naganishii CBS 8797]|uniref:Bola-like protein n=1 Tax=Huiozyma naganishii (strain ATCC MYA-139 / BCRC 22969 / CBS 8797 / KCTC 17520 / NBRC 10181 / NCYC 3082 / Yp74L-3) TaxID=1071383 RepID=J7R726_HUIN7|nr:hypothetical protein KNAG_0E04120 [Kazachstania naganishii CBS 8797]CCK70665.1 hypothetical protein KNAG_0E04120 [Kazachstania naganishii CBS 8797]